jgi:hypothetical protein
MISYEELKHRSLLGFDHTCMIHLGKRRHCVCSTLATCALHCAERCSQLVAETLNATFKQTRTATSKIEEFSTTKDKPTLSTACHRIDTALAHICVAQQ